MKKLKKSIKWQKHIASRSKYQAKRRTPRWKKKRYVKKFIDPQILINHLQQRKKEYINHIAPERFNFVENTNEVLKYFKDAEKLFKKKNNLIINIENIAELSPDAISLLVASINDKEFHHNSGFKGDAPNHPDLKKIFRESGFYNFVNNQGFNPASEGNLLHREMNTKVMPTIAKKATQIGVKYTFKNEEPYEPLYEILIECMSNTNNHASLEKEKKCKWWLYVYNDPLTNNTSYSFLDLGVGIFDSIIVKGYLKKIAKTFKNINIVDDLIGGKIQSRMQQDNEIRGKGIPQIVMYSKKETFKKFIIITNDVKINLKTNEREQLNASFKGTFLYWEIQKIDNYGN